MNVYEKTCYYAFLDHFKKIQGLSINSMLTDTDFVLTIGEVIFFLYINPKSCIVYSTVVPKENRKELIVTARSRSEFLFEGTIPSVVTAHILKKGATTR